MEILHHLADAIAALRKAYEVETDETVSVHIRAAEASTFRAVRAVADGQWDWSSDKVAAEDWVIHATEVPLS
jgi:asparagine synthetase A